MRQIKLNANELSSVLLGLAERENVCILDSCGVGHLGSHLMIAGIRPVEAMEITGDPDDVLSQFEQQLTEGHALIFTVSYDLGLKLESMKVRTAAEPGLVEPDIFVSRFDTLVVHDYSTGSTFLTGNEKTLDESMSKLERGRLEDKRNNNVSEVESNFTPSEYIDSVEVVKEYIRRGDTYQTNLTQQLRVKLAAGLSPETIFARLRREHPAPFSAFIKRKDSIVISASPERFLRISKRRISASPIKGTRPRGATESEDSALRTELASSRKDRAENTMIVDLLRNDLGRVCEFGSVEVERLCEIEEHPTLFHLVSTINGQLRTGVTFSDVIRALFPCGSITGAPKIRTMEIIDEIEPVKRGLSMGAIGYYIPELGFDGLQPGLDLSVAIRTMVVRGRDAVFNVGGGITIDSDGESEYEESLIKAQALLGALGNKQEIRLSNLQENTGGKE